MIFWLGASCGLFVGVAIGVGLTSLFAATAVTQAHAEAETWRRESAMWRERALGLGKVVKS